MVNTTSNSTEDLIKKLQSLKGQTELKFHKNTSNYYDNMDIRMDEDPFVENAQGYNLSWSIIINEIFTD